MHSDHSSRERVFQGVCWGHDRKLIATPPYFFLPFLTSSDILHQKPEDRQPQQKPHLTASTMEESKERPHGERQPTRLSDDR